MLNAFFINKKPLKCQLYSGILCANALLSQKERYMKRIVAFLLCLVMAFSLGACKDSAGIININNSLFASFAEHSYMIFAYVRKVQSDYFGYSQATI